MEKKKPTPINIKNKKASFDYEFIDTYTADDTVTYIVSIINSGSTAFGGLTVTDDLGGYTFGTDTVYPLSYVDGSIRYYINGALQPSPAAVAGPPLTVSGISVPAGGNATIVYETAITQFAPLATGDTVTNTATLAGGGISTPPTASETIRTASTSNLTITKSINPQTVTENSRVTYTFVIQNTGNTEVIATDNAIVTDTFNPILTDIAVSFNGTAWTAPANYTYDEVTGAWVVTPGVSTLTVTGTI